MQINKKVNDDCFNEEATDMFALYSLNVLKCVRLSQ